MHLTETATFQAPPATVFDYVDDLSNYPEWLHLVHSARPSDDLDPDGRPAWDVELRAKIGLFARSKRLRMVRTVFDEPHSVSFERREVDGRDHAMWALQADLRTPAESVTELTMQLAYDGDLWAGGGLIQGVLNGEIKRGRDRLAVLLSRR